MRCGVQGCPRTNHNIHSYKNHMFIKHKDVLHDAVPISYPRRHFRVTLVQLAAMWMSLDDMCSEEHTVEDGMELDRGLQLSDEKHRSALFRMKAKEINKV